MVLDAPSAAANLIRYEPSAILLIKEEEASSVLVYRVACTAPKEEIGSKAALLIVHSFWVPCVQLDLPAVAQTKQ